MTSTLNLDQSLVAERLPVTELPIIDFHEFIHGDGNQKKAVATRLAAACRQVGFFYITGHGVPETLISHVFDCSRSFFSLQASVKDKVSMHNSKAPYSGWRAVAERINNNGLPDVKESFRMGLLANDSPAVQSDAPTTVKNQWPDDPQDFQQTMMDYIEALENLCREILHAIALALEIEENYFDRWFTDKIGTLTIHHYPPQSQEISAEQIGCKTHTDFDAITILAQDNQGGLQVKNISGSWIEARPVEGTFIVNIGDLMARWTNDVFSSTLHRVVNTSGHDRYSVTFFRGANPQSIVECIPSCVPAGEEPTYPPITALEHTQERLHALLNLDIEN